jgi:hypothetical protein
MMYLWLVWDDDEEWFTVARNADEACPFWPNPVKGMRRLEAIPEWDSWDEKQRMRFHLEKMQQYWEQL